MLSTTKLFIIIVAAFILIAIFVIGPDPFSFINPYFKPSENPPAASTEPEFIVLPGDTSPTEIKPIDR